MTENQEKELFSTLATIVTEVRGLKSDVQEIRIDVQEIRTDVRDIKEVQSEHTRILEEHSQILERLDAKTDSIAEVVMRNDKRLTAVEDEISNLRGGVH